MIDIFSLKQDGKSNKKFVEDIKNAIVNSNQITENERQKGALKVFCKGLDDINLGEAIDMKQPKTIDEALRVTSSGTKSKYQYP